MENLNPNGIPEALQGNGTPWSPWTALEAELLGLLNFCQNIVLLWLALLLATRKLNGLNYSVLYKYVSGNISEWQKFSAPYIKNKHSPLT